MQAVILAGGRGTRLSQLYPDLPKALVPVAGRPFLAWLFAWLGSHGIADAHLALGHRSEQITEWLRLTHLPDFNITASTEPRPLDTGGAVKHVQPVLRSNPFMVLNGDSLLPNLDLRAFQVSHRDSGCLASLAAVRISDAARFGTVEFNQHGRLIAFREKSAAMGAYVSAGIYLISQQLLADIESDTRVSIERDVFPTLAKRRAVNVFRCEPPLLDMGTPDGLREMGSFLSDNGKAAE